MHFNQLTGDLVHRKKPALLCDFITPEDIYRYIYIYIGHFKGIKKKLKKDKC